MHVLNRDSVWTENVCIVQNSYFVFHALSWPQGRERSSPEHRRFSMMEASGTDAEVARLRQRLLSTEEALRNALEHNQEVDQLVQAMRTRPDKSQVKLHKRHEFYFSISSYLERDSKF